jgi:hypothetical protein
MGDKGECLLSARLSNPAPNRIARNWLKMVIGPGTGVTAITALRTT